MTVAAPPAPVIVETPARYSVELLTAEHGALKSDAGTAAAGTTVTLTATPESGWQLESLQVRDRDGNEIPCAGENGAFSFTMPVSDVTVAARFAEAETKVDVAERFQDVSETDWFYPYVQEMWDRGIMNGIDELLLGPNLPLERCMMVVIFYRMAGSPPVTAKAVFSDVPEDAWYADAVSWAAECGIIRGYGNGRFGFEDDLTRQQLAVILYRFAEYLKLDVSARADLSGYTDADRVSDWAQDGMRWANALGLFTGRTEDSLDPEGILTRGEIAAVLSRFLALFA